MLQLTKIKAVFLAPSAMNKLCDQVSCKAEEIVVNVKANGVILDRLKADLGCGSRDAQL